MEIYHHIGINADYRPVFYQEVLRLQIPHKISPLPGHEIGIVTFDIPESNPRWETVKTLIAAKPIHPVDIEWIDFTPEEIIAAEWCRLIPAYEWGYPQPERNMKWMETTFEGGFITCGNGMR
ncbi:MAG TPA: hypothetical protein PLV53_05750 [Anaerolineaceae bacterium]|nr:hypothetical protein [Anaerolineaceae bacterium]